MSKWAVWKSPATNYVGWVKGCSAQEEGYQYSFSDLCEDDMIQSTLEEKALFPIVIIAKFP